VKRDSDELWEDLQEMFDAAVEAGEIYADDMIWLVLDGEGSLIGEVQAACALIASLLAAQWWPSQIGEARTVVLKEDYQAERN
jgi:hypothetical protein